MSNMNINTIIKAIKKVDRIYGRDFLDSASPYVAVEDIHYWVDEDYYTIKIRYGNESVESFHFSKEIYIPYAVKDVKALTYYILSAIFNGED